MFAEMLRDLVANVGPLNREEWEKISQLLSGISCFSPQLNDILCGTQPEVLPHFAQFMELYASLHYLTFWSDAEKFQSLFKSGINIASKCQLPDKSEIKNCVGERNIPRQMTDIMPVSEVPELLTGRPIDLFEDPNYSQKDVQDTALRIFSQYISLEAPDSVGAGAEIRKQLIQSICPVNGQISADCFQPVQQHVFASMQKRFFEKFLESSQLRSYLSVLISEERINLADIISFHHTLALFLEFAEDYEFLNVLQFVMSAIQFEAQWTSAVNAGNHDCIWAQNDAMLIYERYLSLQAENKIPCSDSLRELTEENICAESGIQPDCFRPALIAAFLEIESLYLRLFLQSELFRRYLDKIGIHTQKNERSSRRERANSFRIRQKSSNCNVMHTLPNCNSLSLENSPSGNCQANNFMEVTSQDGGQSHSLSRASSEGASSLELSGSSSKFGKLTMGKVDALGRFVLLTENEPVCQKSSVLARVAKKLNNPVDAQRKHEEAALEAQKIIEDTLSLCLSFGDTIGPTC